MNPRPHRSGAQQRHPTRGGGPAPGQDQTSGRPSDPNGERRARTLLEALERERAQLLRDALTVASSRSWRLASALARLGRRLTLRPAGQRSALDTLIERLVNLELRYGPLQVPVRERRLESAGPLPKTTDVVLWGGDDEALSTSIEQVRRSGASRIFVASGPDIGNGSSPGQEPEITRLPAETPATPAAGIDAGLRLSDAALIVLLHAGLKMPPDWLERMRSAAASAPDVGLVAAASDHGLVATGLIERPSWLLPDAISLLSGGEAGERLRVSVFDAGCIAITRRALTEVGGFDPLFEDVQHAAFEFAARLREHGLACVLADDLVVQSPGDAPPLVPSRHRRPGRKLARKLAGPEADRRHVRAELRSMLQLERRIERIEADPSKFAEAVAASGRRPLRSIWVGLASRGPGPAGIQAAAGEVAGLRQLGLEAQLAVPAHEIPRLPEIDAREAVGFEDGGHLARLAQQADIVIASHAIALPLLSGLRPQPRGVMACVLRSVPRELPRGLDDVLLMAPSEWLCRRLGKRFGRRFERFELSADGRYFHPTPDEPSDGPRLQITLHLRVANASESLSLLDRLAASLPADASLATFGTALASLERRGVAVGRWAQNHLEAPDPGTLASLLGRTDILLDLARTVPNGEVVAGAMACGAIPIVREDCAAAEIIEDGADGVVIRSDDPAAWHEVVQRLSQNWPRLRSLQTAAIQSATRRTQLLTAMSQYVVFERAHQKMRSSPARAARSGSARSMRESSSSSS